MAIQLRIILIVVSVLTLFYTLRKIRQSKMNISDSLFWIVFALLLIIFSVFPQVIFFLANIAGIQSPQNLLFLVIIALLALKMFLMSLKISQLNDKITDLAQKTAIYMFEKEQDKQDK